MVLGTVTLPRPVKIEGKSLAAGSYQVRLTADTPPPVVGQSPDGARYVEFLKAGQVVARDVATVVPNADIVEVGKAPKPPTGTIKVQLLKGNDYLRVWINRAGNNYLIHLPTAA
jgi:hypothetical protein